MKTPRLSALTMSLLVACALLFGALAIPLVTGTIFPAGDMADWHLPTRFLYQRALQAGESFLWTSDLGNGLYLHGEGQAGMAHPLHLVLYRFLPLGVALNLEMLSSYAIALAGMWLLLRRLGFSAAPSIAGAMIFAFSGFNLLHLNHVNAVAVVAHIPWLIWASDLLLAGATPRLRAGGFAGVAVTLGSQFLVRFPQCVWMALVAAAWFAAFRLATGTPARRLLLLAGALVAGAMIGGVQVLPTLDAARESYRATITSAFRLTFSLHPLNLVQLFSPYTFAKRIYAPVANEQFVHEFGIYNGALSTLSVFWIAMRWSALRRKPLSAALACLAVLGLILSLGRYGGLYPLLAHLPGVSGFRAPTRHIILTQFAFAGMAAVVLEDLIALSRRASSGSPEPLKWWPLGIPVAVSAALVLAGVALAHAGGPATDSYHLRGAAAVVGPLFMGTTAGLMALGAQGRRAALPLLAMLCATDLAAWGTRHVWAERPVPISAIGPMGGVPPAARPGDTVFPDIRNSATMNRFVLRELRSAAAYTALARPRPAVLDEEQQMRVAGVNWVWTPSAWEKVEDPMPRARLVSDWRVASTLRADVQRLDVSRTALVDGRLTDEISGEPGTARVLREQPGRLFIETRAPHPQLLVLTERFHSGWRVLIDGRTAPVVRVYEAYLGCVVPAGTREVTFTFAPASARQGLWLTLAGIAATLLGAWAVGRASGSPEAANVALSESGRVT
jgi:hypothetical protein